MTKVSIIIPHRTDRALRCMQSIKDQTYTDIEVIVINDEERRGAPWARNQGIAKANGDFLFFCDDDITLDKYCIEKMVSVLRDCPDISFVYCNYTMTGGRNHTHTARVFDFKKLQELNYISTMSMVRKSTMCTFDESLNRFQDWDVWLSLSEKGHIGKWINEFLFSAHFDQDAISMGGDDDYQFNCGRVSDKHNISFFKTLSVVIPVHNQLKYLKHTVDSLLKYPASMDKQLEIIIVNDECDEETTAYIRSIKDKVNIINNDTGSRWFTTKAWNIGIKESSGYYICLLNSDVYVSSYWADPLLNALREGAEVSCVGPMSCSCSSPQEISLFNTLKEDIYKHIDLLADVVKISFKEKYYIAKITGFCMMVSKYTLHKIGWFDENLPSGGNEADWLIRGLAKNMYPIICTDSYVHHFGGKSYGADKKMMWGIGNDYLLQKHGLDKISYLEKTLNKELKVV